MDKKITLIGLIIALLTTTLFALFMLFNWTMGSYFVCIFLAIGYLVMISGIISNKEKNKSLNYLALAFGIVYSILIFIVYYTQVTVVNKKNVSEDVLNMLNYSNLNLMFYLDLLGYGFMALSTFFLGLLIESKNKIEKAFKILLMGHGIFFLPCLIMPMTPLLDKKEGSSSNGGVIALEIWCIYFMALCIVGIISIIKNKKEENVKN